MTADHQNIISGKFINLRIIQTTDAEITLSWRQSKRAELLNQGATTIEQQSNWISSRPESEQNFIIELKDGKPVGMLSLVAIDLVGRKAESARFLIGDEESVKGIPVAVEAMKLLYELAFDKLGLHRIYGTIASHNPLMIKWQKYLGMKEEGILRDHYFIGGEFRDAVCLGLLEDEYRTVSLPRMQVLMKIGKK